MTDSTANSVSVRVPKKTYDSMDAERDRIKQATQKKPPTFTALVDAAWWEHLGRKAPEAAKNGPAPAPQNPHASKLLEILASGDQAVIDAVTQNIDVFYDRLRRAEPKRKHG